MHYLSISFFGLLYINITCFGCERKGTRANSHASMPGWRHLHCDMWCFLAASNHRHIVRVLVGLGGKSCSYCSSDQDIPRMKRKPFDMMFFLPMFSLSRGLLVDIQWYSVFGKIGNISPTFQGAKEPMLTARNAHGLDESTNHSPKLVNIFMRISAQAYHWVIRIWMDVFFLCCFLGCCQLYSVRNHDNSDTSLIMIVL